MFFSVIPVKTGIQQPLISSARVWSSYVTGASDGEVYAVQDGEGNYALFEITAISYEWSHATMSVRYKYQPDGSKNFP